MDMKQIAPMLNNQILPEVLGESVTVNEDLSNIVDVGTALANANAVDPFSKKLVNVIGKMVFVDRIYRGGSPRVLMDGWTWGSVMAKKENSAWRSHRLSWERRPAVPSC